MLKSENIDKTTERGLLELLLVLLDREPQAPSQTTTFRRENLISEITPGA